MESFSYGGNDSRAVAGNGVRRKYREDGAEERVAGINIMHDPRVFRGSNVSNRLLSNSSSNLQEKKASKETMVMMRKAGKRLPYRGLMRVSTPPPVRGRQHADIQTEEYLEVLSDRPAEVEQTTQTPGFLDRPSSPLFVRAKTGIDVETQIQQGDLFDFDLEVEPLLEVLVGRTLHVAMLEVMQEEELEAVRLQLEEFEAIRNVELAEVQRLEADARRKLQEKQRRLAQEQKRVEEQRKLESKVAARAFAQQYLATLHDEVFDVLERDGQFIDPLRREIQELFLPKLIEGVSSQFTQYETAVRTLNEMLAAANESAATFAEEAVRIRKEEEEEQEILRLGRERDLAQAAEEARLAKEQLKQAEAPVEDE